MHRSNDWSIEKNKQNVTLLTHKSLVLWWFEFVLKLMDSLDLSLRVQWWFFVLVQHFSLDAKIHRLHALEMGLDQIWAMSMEWPMILVHHTDAKWGFPDKIHFQWWFWFHNRPLKKRKKGFCSRSIDQIGSVVITRSMSTRRSSWFRSIHVYTIALDFFLFDDE